MVKSELLYFECKSLDHSWIRFNLKKNFFFAFQSYTHVRTYTWVFFWLLCSSRGPHITLLSLPARVKCIRIMHLKNVDKGVNVCLSSSVCIYFHFIFLLIHIALNGNLVHYLSNSVHDSEFINERVNMSEEECNKCLYLLF